MRGRLGYWLIALDGFVIALIAAFAEFIGMDIDQFHLGVYLSSQTQSKLWWTTFAVPFVAGIVFIVAAIVGPRLERAIGKKWPFFLSCVFVGSLLVPIIGGLGTFALIGSLIASGAALGPRSATRLRGSDRTEAE